MLLSFWFSSMLCVKVKDILVVKFLEIVYLVCKQLNISVVLKVYVGKEYFILIWENANCESKQHEQLTNWVLPFIFNCLSMDLPPTAFSVGVCMCTGYLSGLLKFYYKDSMGIVFYIVYSFIPLIYALEVLNTNKKCTLCWD